MVENKNVTRRKFLKYGGGVAAVAVVAAAGYGIYEGTKPTSVRNATSIATIATSIATSTSAPEAIVFKVPRSDEIIDLDPSTCYVVPSIESLSVPYERLIEFKEDASGFEPVLAESWDISSDAKTFTFHLRKNVRFHDGTIFDANAVKFTFDRMNALQGGPQFMYADINSVEVTDTNTATFVLNHPNSLFIDALAAVWGPFIMSPSYVKAHATSDDPWAHKWMTNNMCGTGAYIVDEWVRGDHISFLRFKDYWGGWEDKHLDSAEMPIIKSWVTERAELEKGDLDMIFPEDVNLSDVSALAQNPDLSVSKHVVAVPTLIMLNTQHGPFTNKEVRKALSYLLDYDSVVGALYGYAVQSQGPVPKICPGHDDTLFTYSYDPTTAKALLKDAGYSAASKLSLAWLSGNDNEGKIAQIFKSSAAAAGVDIEPTEMTWPAMYDLITGPANNRPDMMGYVWPPDYVDPSDFLYPMYQSAQAFAYGYSSPKFDSVIAQALQTADAATRVSLYKQAQQILLDDVPAIWVIDQAYPSVTRSSLTGYKYNVLYSFYSCGLYSLYK